MALPPPLSPLLYFVLNVSHRSYVSVPSPNRVVGHEEHKDGRPYHSTPVRLARGRAWSSRKELEYPAHGEKAQRNHINGAARFSKAESGWWERFAAEPLLEET